MLVEVDLDMKYLVYLEPQPEGGYTVTVPALPGCISEGDTKEEALANITEAIEAYVEVMKKHGREDELPKAIGEVEAVEVKIA